MKVALCGYGIAGVYALGYLASLDDVDLFVYTHEARPHAQSLDESCGHIGIDFTYDDISESIRGLDYDIIASVYYRNIIKKHVIDSCSGRIFNAHPSLLPAHRGCSSLAWSLIGGDSHTGVTFHYIDEGTDTGNILFQVSMQIGMIDTAMDLHRRAEDIICQYFPAAFELVVAGFPGAPQVGKASYHKRGAPNDGEIKDIWPSVKVDRFIRAMTYPPLPYATYHGVEVKTFDEYKFLATRKYKSDF